MPEPSATEENAPEGDLGTDVTESAEDSSENSAEAPIEEASDEDVQKAVSNGADEQDGS